jgi:hypothetical protein
MITDPCANIKTVMNREEYDKEIIGMISDSGNWPDLIYFKEWIELLRVTKEEISRGSIMSGSIARVLIQQQMLEQLILNLIELGNLFIKAQIWPCKYDSKLSPEPGKALGYYFTELEKSISYKSKGDFIRYSKEFNKLRIDIVHRISTVSSHEDIIKIASKADAIFEEKIMELFFNCRREIDVWLREINRGVDWDQMA